MFHSRSIYDPSINREAFCECKRGLLNRTKFIIVKRDPAAYLQCGSGDGIRFRPRFVQTWQKTQARWVFSGIYTSRYEECVDVKSKECLLRLGTGATKRENLSTTTGTKRKRASQTWSISKTIQKCFRNDL